MELKAKVEKRFFRGIPESLDFPIAPNWSKKIPGYILEVLVRTSAELFQERGRSRGGCLASREQGQSRVQVSGQGVRADHDAHQRREGVPCSGWRTHMLFISSSARLMLAWFFGVALDVTANCICEIHCLALDGFNINTVHKLSSVEKNSQREISAELGF